MGPNSMLRAWAASPPTLPSSSFPPLPFPPPLPALRSPAALAALRCGSRTYRRHHRHDDDGDDDRCFRQLSFLPPSCSSSDNVVVEPQGSSPHALPRIAVLMEVEGVVADIHRFGHRHAFNVAFQKLGLDCAHWTEPVYRDLLRLAGGDEEKMLYEFFERIGWPMALPTGEEGAFIQHLLQEKKIALENRIINGSVSLRPGVENFVDEVIEARVPLVVLGAYNKIGETITRSLIGKLGVERSRNIIFVGEKEVQNSVYGQVVFGAGSSAGPDEALAIEAAKAVLAEKQRMAEEVAAMLNLTVEIDTGSSKLSGQAIALLRAGAEMAGLPVQQCILLAGGYLGVQTAERIGMPCVAVRSSLTARAEFPSAIAVLDDFGSGSLSLPRLRKLRYP